MKQTYSIGELLSLRNTNPTSGSILPGNSDVAEIVRNHQSCSSEGKPMAPKRKQGSSDSSDEIVFKGNKDRRATREAAREAARETPAPREALTVEPAPELAPEPIRDRAREPAQNPAGEMQWKYHGRSDSDTVTADPLQAPPGVSAQKHEGFQRFYKAVVSPTHVRVTAGGRIVPNTRGPPSPTSRRTRDNSAMDGQVLREQPVQSNPSFGQVGMNQPVALWPHFVHGFPGGLQQIPAPLSVIPLQFGPHLAPGYPFQQQVVPQPMVPQPPLLQPTVPQPIVQQPPTVRPGSAQPTTDNATKETNTAKSGDVQSENGSSTDKQEQVKITSPENFDRTKPFYFNGQLLYPVAAGFPGTMGTSMMPIQMVGLPHGASPNTVPHLGGSVMQMSSNGTGQIIGGPYPQGSHGLPGIQMMPNRINIGFQPPTAPPASSIKISEVTKKQIATLRSSLKYCEDQLQYNRHQIDETSMRETMKKLETDIQRFEANLRTQLEQECKVGDTQSDPRHSHRPQEPLPPTESTGFLPSDQEVDDNLSIQVNLSDTSLSTETQDQKSNWQAAWEMAADDNGRLSLSAMSHSPSSLDPLADNRISRLPVQAALAPPFLPRGTADDSSEQSPEARDAAKKQFWAAPPIQPPQTRPTKPQGSSDGHMGVPYLLGALPNGVNPRTAREQDYVYSRALTEEECRARYLYWGKAPQSVMQGLPKFDGKHFYHPSPVKVDTGGSNQRLAVPRAPASRHPVNFDFRGTKSDGDPFRPMTPIQQYESAKPVNASEDGYASGRHVRTESMETEIYIPAVENNGSSAETTMSKHPGMSSEGDDNSLSSISTNEKRSEKGALWQLKLKKSSTSSALSSTTAQGYLPQYSGSAAASLSPSMTKNLVSPIREISPSKASCVVDHSEGGALLAPTAEKHGENRPPNASSSLGMSRRRDMHEHFKL
ncbi:hypothetical protein B0H66DRAFT_322227 [Apodospora peruviana]|uniref:Uncharacterized protein n=1 Tax=Apodospora peruviana TaxID=516989 RepID=A0AAE0HXL9_9PEZI|nr:hypothetical protein B0H66DRAFT_322227 [Apodospora peruviana]